MTKSMMVTATVGGLLLGAISAVQGQDVVFDNRQNVNVVNASDVILTSSWGTSPQKLRFNLGDEYWEGVANPPGGTNSITIDFKTNRSAKTVRLYHYAGSTYAAVAGFLQTSTDGAVWTLCPSTWVNTPVGGGQADIVLDAAVNTRYLKIGATSINGATHRWLLTSLRVFGDTGTLTDSSGVVDLLASGGFSGGIAVTHTGLGFTTANQNEFVNDALNPLKRQVIYAIDGGDKVTFQFDRTFIFRGIGLGAQYGSASASFDVHVSTNGTDWVLAGSRTGVTAFDTYLTFTAPKRAKYVRITFTSWSGFSGNAYLGDIHIFGVVPVAEPQAPVAQSQSVAVTFATPKAITLGASDANGDDLTYMACTLPTHGALTGTAPNLTYTPTYGFHGADSFTFQATDGVLTSTPATVSLTVDPAGAVRFDNRANVNILSASNAVLTSLYGNSPAKLRFSHTEDFWEGGFPPNAPNGTNWIQVNFQALRNIKTIRMLHYRAGSYEALSGLIQTSSDGLNWTERPSTWTVNLTAHQTEVVLDAAVEDRFLRIVVTNVNNANDRWLLESLRVFGDTGALVDVDGVVDLVSGTGYSGNIALTLNGTVGHLDCTPAEFVNDALNPLKRQVIYQVGVNEGFTLQFDRDHVLKTLGLFTVTGFFDANATFTVETSTNGVAYTTVLTQTGGIPTGPCYFALTPSIARYLRWKLTSTTSADNRISDIQVFGNAPIPPAPPAPIGTVIMLR